MNRSKRYVIVPFCLMAQGIRAQGIARKFSSSIKPVTDLLMKYDVNIIQMRCPELYFDGFIRQPCGKDHYDNFHNRKICQQVAEKEVELMKMLKDHDHEIVAVLGINFSPSCAVDYLSGRPPNRKKGKGIYIEELDKVMRKEKIYNIPFIGISIYRIEETINALKKVLGG